MFYLSIGCCRKGCSEFTFKEVPLYYLFTYLLACTINSVNEYCISSPL